MINYNNHNITEMHYNGHKIKYAYGCDGSLVFGESPSPFIGGKAKIIDNSGNTYVIECNSSTTLVSQEEHMATGGINNSAYTEVWIGDCVTTLGDQLFQVINVNHNVGASSITLSNNVTTIGNNVFEGTQITSIILPSGVTSIGIGVFKDCRNLQSIDIPTGITEIPISAFEDCTSLSSVTLHSGITSIGQSAFLNCTGLQSATVLSPTPPTLGTNAFSFTDGGMATYPIYVPDVEAYKAAPVWEDYGNRLFQIQ